MYNYIWYHNVMTYSGGGKVITMLVKLQHMANKWIRWIITSSVLVEYDKENK